MLEQLARDSTGWPARAVEYFQRLATTQHLNHRRPENLRTPDLRRPAPLERLDGRFDPFAHTAEVRRIPRRLGRYNISNVGLHRWRLRDFRIESGEPRPVSGSPGRYRFDLLGLGRSTGRTIETAAAGGYRFGEVAPGTYTVFTVIEGSRVESETSAVVPGVATHYELTATAQGRTIRGTLTNSGVGVPGADIILAGETEADEEVLRLVQTSAGRGSPGTYLFTGLDPGTYSVRALRGGVDLGLEEVVVIRQGAAGPVLTATVDGNAVSGELLSAGRRGVAAAAVLLVGDAVSLGASTSDRGAFRFRDLPAGNYRLSVAMEETELMELVAVTRDSPLAVDDVPGIGGTFRERLEERGITHPAEVASMDDEALAEALDTSRNRASVLRAAALRFLEAEADPKR